MVSGGFGLFAVLVAMTFISEQKQFLFLSDVRKDQEHP